MSSNAATSASQWVHPSTRPEHVEQLISGVDRYNPQNLQVLHEYLEHQCESGEYDCLANLAILKLYQFNPPDFEYQIVISILLKALTAAPLPDFNLCLALLGEAPVATVPASSSSKPVKRSGDGAGDGDESGAKADEVDPTEASAEEKPSAGNLADLVIVKLAQLSQMLLSARFRAFWSALHSHEYEDVRGYTSAVVDFDDAVRKVALRSVASAFRSISQERLGSYLDLQGSELVDFIKKQPGWSVGSDGKVHVPSNNDNEIKATVIREDLQLDQLTRFLAQTQNTPVRAS